jgi:hypothetical protein
MLNEQQEEAKKLINNYITNSNGGVFGLLGAGGTGKTFLITSIEKTHNFQYLAPTNKAVNILRKSLIKNDVINPNVKTVDSFFNFKMTKDEYNKTKYSYGIPNKLNEIKGIIVDEVSMLRDKHVELLKSIDLPIIFLGDDKQIPPVENEEKSYIDTDGFRNSLAFSIITESYELTQQNRQKEGSEMFKFITGFRNNMSKEINLKQLVDLKKNGIDILFLKQNSEELKEFIKSNDSVCVSFKNNTAEYFNYKIGSIKTDTYKYNVKSINVGDVLLFDKFYRNEDVTFYTSEKVVIEQKGEDKVLIDTPFYSLPIEHFLKVAVAKTEEGFPKLIWLKDSELTKKVYQRVFTRRKEFEKDRDSGCLESVEKLKQLNTFYSDFKNKFAELKKPNAMTAHKSQGSTFKNVIVPVYDYYLKKHQDTNQLFYVAISRASEKLIFVDGWCNFNNSSKRVIFTQEERCLISSSQNWLCNICETELFDGTYEIDHIERLGDYDSFGNLVGTNTISNLQSICKSCHKIKTNEQRK